MSRAVLFLTSDDDILPREFAAVSTDYEVAFAFGLRSECEWAVSWVHENGQVQVMLTNILSGQWHFLGSDPEKAMQSARRLIKEWEFPGVASKPN